MRRAGRLDPGRRAADPQGDRRDRQGIVASARSSSTCAPTRSWSRRRSTCSSPAPTSPSRSISTGCARSTTARSARPACSTARSRRSGCCARAASGSTSTPRCSTARRRDEVAAFLDYVSRGARRRRHHRLARLCLRARARTRQHFLNRRKTKQLFRDIFRRGRGAPLAAQPLLALPRFPRRQPGVPLHALGQPDPQHLRLAAALLPARRRLRRAPSRS